MFTGEYEDSRSNLKSLAEWYKENPGSRNEATTRLLLVDRLFFECLNWSKQNDVILEEPYGGKYTDYTFSAPRKVLVVEAKKEGDYFDLPLGSKKIERSLVSLIRDYPNLKSAILQAIGYCQSRGVTLGVVTNGHQLVSFIATRTDGTPPLEGKALVFESFDSMLENYLTLWQALSKPGVEQKWLQRNLLGDIPQDLPSKLSSSLTIYPGVKARNVFQTDLQTLSELIIEDLLNSEELRKPFLEECYTQSGALSQYALISKTILQARYAALFAPETDGPTTLPVSNKQGISPELLAESLSRRPILLIGDVGVGKTTFVRNLMYLEAAPLFENSITFYLDLGSQATLSIDLKSFVNEEIAKQLDDKHNVDIHEAKFVYGVYHGELEKFKRGIYSSLRESNPELYEVKKIEFLEEKLKNKERHLKEVFQHIAKARRKQIVVFIDNADQRDEEIQQQAFLISQELAENWRPVTVFVALRPETFYRSQRLGALSGYHPKAFTILPPRIDRVIIKRLNFAKKISDGKIPLETISNVELNLKRLGDLIAVFLHSLEAHTGIAECIDNVAGGNVRLALNLVKSFFGSGHVDTYKITAIYEEKGFYTIPLHEFVRAIMYGDAEHFIPEQSPIVNLFDISTADSKEHFLLPILLGALQFSESPDSEEGFIESTKTYDKLQALGFTPEQIDIGIVRAHRKKLLETSARRIPQPGIEMPQMLRITTVGAYHIERLCRMFAYLDALIVDTPILDIGVREFIHNETTA